MRVGVVAIQGDFAKHVRAVERCSASPVEVRTAEDLRKVERAIIPGGESTTVGLLMKRFGLAEALQEAAAAGMPIWGTCMGMILMASEVEDRPNQFRLGLLDVTVRRNAFGAQVHSFEDSVTLTGLDDPVLGVFIRAPTVIRVGETASEIGRYRNQIVAVRQGSLLGTSFHPELTDDLRLHEFFMKL